MIELKSLLSNSADLLKVTAQFENNFNRYQVVLEGLSIDSPDPDAFIAKLGNDGNIVSEYSEEGEKHFELEVKATLDEHKVSRIIVRHLPSAKSELAEAVHYLSSEYSSVKTDHNGTDQITEVDIEGFTFYVYPSKVTAGQDDWQTKYEAERNARIQLLADFQNYRRRSENEKNNFKIEANKKYLVQIFDVIDDFQRALDHEAGEKNFEGLYKGCEMMVEKLINLVKSENLVMLEINKGDKFDPTKMQAIGTLPVQNADEDNTVIHIDQKGYLNSATGEVYRVAKVLIGKHQPA